VIVSGFGDQPVEAGALELIEPELCSRQFGRGRGDMEPRSCVGQRVDEGSAAFIEWTLGVVIVAEGEQVERDERSGRLLGEHAHARIGWVDALLQRLEVQAVVGGDDDLAVDHAAFWQLGGGRSDQLGEVPGHRPFVAATPRNRLLLWTDTLVRIPRIVVRQDGNVIARKTLPWPASPGRVFRVPSSVLDKADPGRGSITVSLG